MKRWLIMKLQMNLLLTATSPKVVITTSARPHGRIVRLCEQFSTVIPNSHVCYRRLALKKNIPQCISGDFTGLININEDRKTPSGSILSHLPNGPNEQFSSV